MSEFAGIRDDDYDSVQDISLMEKDDASCSPLQLSHSFSKNPKNSNNLKNQY